MEVDKRDITEREENRLRRAIEREGKKESERDDEFRLCLPGNVAVTRMEQTGSFLLLTRTYQVLVA